MQLDELLPRLKPKPSLRASFIAQDLADRRLGDADVFSDSTLRPLSVEKVTDQGFPVHDANISILMVQVKSKLIKFSNILLGMDTLGSRVKDARLAAKLSQEALARQVGVSQGLIGQIESGKNQGSKYIAAIARALGVSADWLETGKGRRERVGGKHTEPDMADGRESVSARPILAWDNEEELGDGYVLIPRLDVKFSAGNGKIVWHVDEKGQKQAFRRAWCVRLGINPEHAATIINEGQSMEPRLIDGDSLVVDYKATNIIDGKVYALAYQGELYVKRLFKMPGGGLTIRSDNPDKARFPDMIVAPDDMHHVEIIARVMGVSGAV
ncbi:XRE family transcriptional regulator [Burkholderia metallica]|uniref:XRE family transcriptional regulator n=1 Tax=Burkholderia metallica TaxID=488729 RepID=UPI001CF3E48E|nr:S24 family peptidase [Burkholderia metallica]MCA8017766.1 helix-turn-helix domain-containing protein [Burkholderia metallica]